MRKLAVAAFSFSAAIFFAQYLLKGEAGLILAAILVVCAIALIFIKHPQKAVFIIIAAFMAVGLVYNYCYGLIALSEAQNQVTDERTEIEAICLDYPEFRDPAWRISFDVITDNGTVGAEAYVYDAAAAELRPGDKVGMQAVVSLADKMGDEETGYYFARGDYLTLRKVLNFEITEVYTGSKWKYLHRDIAHAISESIKSVFPEDTAGMALGLVTGDKALLRADKGLNYDMQRSGIYHIATVSGLHVSIICGFLMLIFGRRKWVALPLVPILITFAAISGFRPSVVRAVIMQVFVLMAPIADREDDKITNLSFALFVLLLLNPFAAKDVGLQLSFAATLGIILFSGPMNEKILALKPIKGMKKGRLKSAVISLISTVTVTLSALAFTVPLSAVHFGYFSLISPLTNALIGWAVAPAFILSGIAAITGTFFTFGGTVVAFAVSLFIRYIALIAHLCASLTASSLYVDNPAVVLWLFLVYIAFLAFIIAKLPIDKIVYPGAAAIISLILVLVGTSLYYDLRPGYSVTAIDVGQGQAIVISSGGRTAVIDCGGTYSTTSGDKTARLIRSMGRNSVDVLAVTHYHSDHINGIPALLGQMRVKSAILPEMNYYTSSADEELYELLESENAEIVTCDKDLTFTFGNAEITVFAPIGYGDLNERGLTFLVSCNGFDTLITGDMAIETELALISEKVLPDIECLVVGHHGSAYSTSEELLNTTEPEIGIISCGAFNTYGHPSPETEARLINAGVTYYVTSLEGNITVYSEG